MIGKFFYETFRPREKYEYSEVLTRGLNGNSEPNNKYPWLYARVFAALFFAFAIYSVICLVVKASFYNQTMYFVGGLFLDLALLVLAFELYPYKDFSILLLFAVCLLGGTLADLLSAGIYYIFDVSNGWAIAAVAGIGEEIAKGVATFLFIILLKKKGQPLAGFLIGAAVGTWFSLTENAVYIANEWEGWIKILTALGRAVSAPFSHAMWAAIIGWAFCKFKKPYINLKFYGVIILCMAMHFLCDMPLLDNFPLVFVLIFACAAEAAITFLFGVKIILSERKKALSVAKDCESRQEDFEKFTPEHKANLFLLGAGAIFCALALALSSVFSYAYVYGLQIKFTSVDEYILYMQNGLELSADDTRKYDDGLQNSNEVFVNGDLVYCEQLVTDGQYEYFYCYQLSVTDGSGGYKEEFALSEIYVLIKTDNEPEIYRFVTQTVYNTDTKAVIQLKYFAVKEDIDDIFISYRDGNFIFEEAVGTKKVYSPASIALLCITCAEAVAAIAGWIIIRKRCPKSSLPQNRI